MQGTFPLHLFEFKSSVRLWCIDKMCCVWTVQSIQKELNFVFWLQCRFQHQLWYWIVHTTGRLSWYSGENRRVEAPVRKLSWRDIYPLTVPAPYSRWCWLIVVGILMSPPSSILHPVSFGQVSVESTSQVSSRKSVICASKVLTASPGIFSIFLRVRLFCRRTTQYQVVLHVWKVFLPYSFEARLNWYLGLDH